MAAGRALQSAAGQRLHGFLLLRSTPVPTFRATLEELRHERTGCRVVHLAREDANNAFAVQLRTTPTDSSGVAHILEHSVLCGSRRYPVRDPFFKMLTRSQATFMNAMTAPDYTIYPFSTQNETDFYNLLSVYLDAVFHPLLARMDFLQEGWRVEPEDPRDPNSPVGLKGVVYNEMKGVFSDPDQLFAFNCRQSLLPHGPYGHNFAGYPTAIPSLTHRQLLDFHRTHYHPSNATIFTYGSLPLQRHLQFLDTECLSQFERLHCDTEVPLEPRWTEPRMQRIAGPVNPFLPIDRQATVAENFLFGDIRNVSENFHLHFVSSLLCEGDTSPFYSKLLESGLGSAFAPVHGFSTEARNASFHVGLKGVAEESVGEARTLIDAILADTVRSGFKAANVDSLLHQIELGLRDESANFGLEKILALAGPANHGADLADVLDAERHVAELRRRMAEEPQYLQRLVAGRWVENRHRLFLLMRPGAHFADRLAAAEKSLVAEKLRTPAELEAARQEALQLLEAQTAKVDASLLPKLSVGDLDTATRRYPAEWRQRLLLCPQPTNGVLYFRAKVNLSGLPPACAQLLPAVALLLPKLGTAATGYGRLAERIDAVSGGFACTAYAVCTPEDAHSLEQGLVLSSFCLADRLGDMLSLWREICTDTDWSAVDRLSNLLRMEAADLVSRLTGQGHSFAMSRAAGGLTPAGAASDTLSGVASLHCLQRLAAAEPRQVADCLAAVFPLLFRADGCSFSLTGERLEEAAKQLPALTEALASGQSSADAERAAETEASELLSAANCSLGGAGGGQYEHFEVASMGVNFCSLAVPCPPVARPQFAEMLLAAAHLSARYLHPRVREIGGAYGSGARAAPGAFCFMSYRDPQSLATFDTFAGAADWLADADNLTDADLDEAKLATFKSLDMPVPPKRRGLDHFLTGVTDDTRQLLRDRLLALTPKEVRDVAAPALAGGRQQHRVLLGASRRDLDFKRWRSCRLE